MNCNQEESVQNCPIHKTIALFQKKWSIPVLFELSRHDAMRFSQLRCAVSPITSTMLTTTLRELAVCGLVERIQYNEIPPHVEYRATEKARALHDVFEAMAVWESEYL